eukprot:5469491-Pyramimonas_sp.AAC.1
MIGAASGDSARAMACANHSNSYTVDTPTAGRTAANWRQKQISWNLEKKRDVGGAARKDSENCKRVERSAGIRNGRGRGGQD